MEAYIPSLTSWLCGRAAIYDEISKDRLFYQLVDRVCAMLVSAIRADGKIMIIGNGGSAAEAQHFAAELVGRFRMDRPPIAALALTTDTSIITAWTNDVGFATVFSRQIEALVNPCDVVICFTTSDADETHSLNLLYALKVAREIKGATTICFGSLKTKILADLAHHTVFVPSEDGAIVQEVHLALIHYVCDVIEKELFSE